MKKITLLFLFFICTLSYVSAQCTTQSYQWPSSTVTVAPIPGAQTIATNNWPQNEYSILTGLVVGETYTVAANPSLYITVTEGDATTVITHGLTSVTFVATTADIYCFWAADAACTNGPNTNTLTTIECTTCTCSATAAPSAAATPVPANLATGVEIIYSGADTLIPFEWTDPSPAGNEAISYTFSLGTTATGDDIGSLSVDDTDVLLNYTWAENTTYYWKLEAINCFGSTETSVFSFTTFSCSVSAPNPIASELLPLDTATGVDIDTDPANLAVAFEWNPPSGGDPATSYTISLGETVTGDDIGTIDVLETNVDVNYTWQYDTTYYWFVTAQNCSGTSTASPVYSFTTEVDPLSTNEFESNTFTHSYSKSLETLTLESSNLEMTSIEIYSILGQNVISKPLSNTREVIDIASLNDGVYLAKVFADGSSRTIKFVKN